MPTIRNLIITDIKKKKKTVKSTLIWWIGHVKNSEYF